MFLICDESDCLASPAKYGYNRTPPIWLCTTITLLDSRWTVINAAEPDIKIFFISHTFLVKTWHLYNPQCIHQQFGQRLHCVMLVVANVA